MMTAVTLRNVSKRYGETSVIEELDLTVLDRELMVLVGPSGCGKSTVLRMIAGFKEVTGGTIAIGNRAVNDVAPKDREIAMVFRNYALYPHRPARAALPVEVEFGEPLGDEVIVRGRLGEDLLLCELAPDSVPEAGSRLEIGVEVARIHVFDAQTELRLAGGAGNA